MMAASQIGPGDQLKQGCSLWVQDWADAVVNSLW